MGFEKQLASSISAGLTPAEALDALSENETYGPKLKQLRSAMSDDEVVASFKPQPSFGSRLLKSIVNPAVNIGKNLVSDITSIPQMGEKLVSDIAQKGPFAVGAEMVQPVAGTIMSKLLYAPTADASPEIQEYAEQGVSQAKELIKAYTTDLPKTFTQHPLYTSAVLFPILKELYKSPVFKAAGESLVENVSGVKTAIKEKTPFISKAVQTKKNIRLPAENINPKIRNEYWDKRISLSNEYGKVVDEVTNANPTRTAPFSETSKLIKENYATDDVLKSLVDKNPTLRAIAGGGIDENVQFTLKELNDIKNAFKNKIQQSKLAGNYRGDYTGVMDVVEALQQDIVNPFPEMAEQNAIYGRGIKDFKLLKQLGQEGKTSLGIDTLAKNQDLQLIANRYFSPKLTNEIYRYSRTKTILDKFGLKNFPLIGERNVLGKKKFIPKNPPKG